MYAVSDRKATTVAQCLAGFVWRHGVPIQIIHDRAAEFLSNVLQETAEILSTDRWDGRKVESNTQADALQDSIKGWDDQLGAALFAYQTAPKPLLE